MSGRSDTVAISIDSMFSRMSSSTPNSPTIYVVDQTLRQVNERAYDPGLVAIGPVHHNKGHVQYMEQVKVSYLYQFLHRMNETVEKYVLILRKLEKRARNCYSDMIELPESDKFVEMLLLDGFFIIVLLLKLEDDKDIEGWRVQNEYIFHSIQVQKRVVADLLLVENQLPFFVLSALFDMTKPNHTQDYLSSLVLRQLSWVLPWKHRVKSVPLLKDQNHVDSHLLGMMHQAYLSSEAANVRNTQFKTIDTASELDEMGISFKMVKGVMDVTFTRGSRFTCGRVIQVSHLAVEDYTETMLRNFIAYEQMHPKIKPKHVSDYSALMTYLVNSSKDVEILRRAGIFENMLGGDETVHRMFNQLARDVLIDRETFCYTEVSESANKHCSRRLNKWMATLRRNYFHSPWSTMSVIAAIILLLLTTTQTVFSILPYL